PDFRLAVMSSDNYRPDSCVVGQGGQANFTVFAYRNDGFKGEIALSVEGLPAGVTCVPQTIGPGAKMANLVITAAPDAAPWQGEVKVRGTAVVGGEKVVREARPASITWPIPPGQNIPTVTRLNHSLMLAVRGKAPYSLTPKVERVTVLHGDKVTIPLKVARL